MAKNSTKMIYYFGKTKTEGNGKQKTLLGGKGANLAEMTSIGLPVPPGFTITTEVCDLYYKSGSKLPPGLMDEVKHNVGTLEKELGKKFGDTKMPLLVSVRSGAASSMPGMMNTILNLGLNDEAVVGLANATGEKRFAYDAYRRLINMYGDVVCGVDHEHFEEVFDKIKKRYKAATDNDVPLEGMVKLCEEYKNVFKKHFGKPFPQDPIKQLELAIEAVFKSWMQPRAVKYRQVENITGLLGTAVNVQSMVFGNMGDESGTGVAFTRNPSTGENKFYGEFLINAQGEDVVAGIRTPEPVEKMAKWDKKAYDQLMKIKDQLEKHYRDVQDIEFTIENKTLYMLQTRNGKRTGAAAVKIACDMVKEKLITEKEAVMRIPAGDLTQLLLPSFTPAAKQAAKKEGRLLTVGLPASPGAAFGKPAFTAAEAVDRTLEGEQVLLVRKETNPEDIDGMHSAAGILTSTGGMTSHAAVVARGWGRCCVAGAGEITIDEKARKIKVGNKVFTHKDVISIDGSTGEVMEGEIATQSPKLSGDFSKVMEWADKYRTMKVRTNADTPADAKRARDFGAQGIGLCRTEHMFFEGDRIMAMREMILADNEEDRKKALKKLLPVQRKDFIGIFTAMKGLPVTIRLLDPPLHEFLPHDDKSQAEMASRLNVKRADVKNRVTALHEQNPMLGHRGCRLAVTYPEILDMQVTAITEAVIACKQKKIDAQAEIMIPLVGTATELQLLGDRTRKVIEDVKADKKYKGKLDILIGTMIEIPRAALTADEISPAADFFSFGTNDLTQMTFGYSRDDINTFLPDYLSEEILPRDPFQSLDTSGVGQLVEMGVTKGRSVKKDLKCGICGEHGGDPDSIHFCHTVGLDYVSCSPFRVPIARLAAAQAALANSK
ncbi:pyruvate, phosphate dikinase [Bythopirellula polymerisocia]|uniref:Pyruvate, phosphate dikinase n=1 Tax=Bythopirellula polymerisocia TaxID=2528003 RepID=A0A5C6C2E7_9BACT|nr:pyruvate, phosphate dikinase [Bythopirellula polymerisocia]TWU17831.1 Pyruvate, phosphate dikinase [Bythopirellula polymerisocia]